MTQNAKRGLLGTGPSRQDSAAGGRRAATVAQPSDMPIARPVPVQTSGRLEFAARCPNCRDWHRHVGLGERRAPCGVIYLLEFANKGAA